VVRRKQIEQLERIKSSRDNAAVEKALKDLEKACKNEHAEDNNLLKYAIEASKHRATVGEISSAMESVFGRYTPKIQVVSGAYRSTHSDKAEIDRIIKLVDDFETNFGRRPRILVAKMGQDGHDRGAKVIASGFADLGFDVDVGPLFATPKEVAQQALDCDVHVVGVSSQAAGHLTLVPQLIEELKNQNAENIVVVCGGVIPPQDYDKLYSFGVSCIFGPGTKITKAAVDTLNTITEHTQGKEFRMETE
jgi:methylmalonyl-CoA mutase